MTPYMRKARQKERTCATCGNTFCSIGHGTKFCCNACRRPSQGNGRANREAGRRANGQVDWGREDWSSTEKDEDRAARLGVTRVAVRKARRRRYGPQSPATRRNIDWDTKPLGVWDDGELASAMRISRGAVRDARDKRGIPARLSKDVATVDVGEVVARALLREQRASGLAATAELVEELVTEPRVWILAWLADKYTWRACGYINCEKLYLCKRRRSPGWAPRRFCSFSCRDKEHTRRKRKRREAGSWPTHLRVVREMIYEVNSGNRRIRKEWRDGNEQKT
jgi:hypothetical protein